MEFCSVLCASLDGREVWGRTNICMPESLHCSPDTIHNTVNWLYPNTKYIFKVTKKRIMQNKQTTKKRQPHEVGRVICPFCWKVK